MTYRQIKKIYKIGDRVYSSETEVIDMKNPIITYMEIRPDSMTICAEDSESGKRWWCCNEFVLYPPSKIYLGGE